MNCDMNVIGKERLAPLNNTMSKTKEYFNDNRGYFRIMLSPVEFLLRPIAISLHLNCLKMKETISSTQPF